MAGPTFEPGDAASVCLAGVRSSFDCSLCFNIRRFKESALKAVTSKFMSYVNLALEASERSGGMGKRKEFQVQFPIHLFKWAPHLHIFAPLYIPVSNKSTQGGVTLLNTETGQETPT